MRHILLTLAFLLLVSTTASAQFPSTLNDRWKQAWQNCSGQPCLKITPVQASGPWTGGGTLNDLMFQSFSNCAGTPCLTVTGAGGVYNVTSYGALCDGVTDDSTAVLNAIAAAGNANGGVILFPSGTCVVNSQVLMPNDGQAIPSQKSFRLTGAGPSHNGRTGAPSGGTILKLGFSGANGKILTLGGGYLEIDHLTFQETGAATTTPFIYTTNTTLHVHDNEFYGSTAKTGTTCDQDVIILGGTNTVVDNTANSPFQGYSTVIRDNYTNRTRRFVYCRTFCNGNVIANNTIWTQSGSNITTAVTAATNANPAVLTVTGHGFPSTIGATVSLNFSGFTGNWAALNGSFVITYVSANTFSVPVNSTTFGALTGSPVYNSGAAFELLGLSTNATTGNLLTGNLVEMIGYPIAFLSTSGFANTFTFNNLFDSTSLTMAYYRFFGTAGQFSTVIDGYRNDAVGVLCLDQGNGATCMTNHQSQTTTIGQPWLFLNHLTFQGGPPTGPYWQDVSGNVFQLQFLPPNQWSLSYTPNGGSAGGVVTAVRQSATDMRLAMGDGFSTNFVVYANNGAGDLRLESGATGGSLWLGDTTSQQFFVNSGMLNRTNTTFPSDRFASTAGLSWSSTASPSGTQDVGVTRNAANRLEVNNGTAGSFADVEVRGVGVGAAPNGQNTITFANFIFANIATALTANGQIGYCSDCTIANPCAGAGTGAIAKRLNGVNVCN